jgi:hypothetical protein
MTPSTKALSSLSAPQISFAQLIASGPYGIAARPIKYALQCSQAGMSQMASRVAAIKPREVQSVMMEARERK